MKVIITGATGMVGKGVLLECMDHPDITNILSISRRKTDIQHPTLTELIHEDFSEFSSVAAQLKGYDACYACMGVSSAGMKEEPYTRFTYDFTIALAKELYRTDPNMTFIYVSGQGTDSTEKGRTMWARVKGKTENTLINMGFKQTFMFRPGAIIPVRGVEPSSKIYKVLVNNLAWLIKLLKKLAPNSIVDSSQIGLAMIHATQRGYEKHIVNPVDMLRLA